MSPTSEMSPGLPSKANKNANNASSPDTDQQGDPAVWIVDRLSKATSFSYGLTTIYTALRTDYQDLLIADLGPYGRALFLDGLLQVAEADEALYHEPIVHAPCLVHSAPRSVLILGGADGAAAREALRWRTVQRVVIVEIDPAVVDACRQYLPNVTRGALDDPRTRLIIDDARNFVNSSTDVFDVIICDLTDPVEGGPSAELFTPQFFKALQTRLTPDGAVCVQSGPAALCDSQTIFPRVCASLRAVFSAVHPMQVFVPTYASPLALTLACNTKSALPTVETVDKMLRTQVDGDMSVLDGRAFHALFGIPRMVRNAIESETRVFTFDEVVSTSVGPRGN